MSRTSPSSRYRLVEAVGADGQPGLVQHFSDASSSIGGLLFDAPLFFDPVEGKAQLVERRCDERVRLGLECLERLQ